MDLEYTWGERRPAFEREAAKYGPEAVAPETVTLTREQLSGLLVSAGLVGLSLDPAWATTRGELQAHLRTYPKLRTYVTDPEA